MLPELQALGCGELIDGGLVQLVVEVDDEVDVLGDACLAQRHLHRIEPDGRGEGVVRRHVDDDGALRFGPRLLIGGHERVAATRQQAKGKNQQACEEGTKDVGH